MSEECTHDCSTCGAACQSREQPEKSSPESFLEAPHEMSHIKKVIAVVSGKGGVGKSLVTSLLAVEMNRRGLNTAIMDADITGPSVPKAFGINERASGSEIGMFPVQSKTGIGVMSMNLLLDNPEDPVVWRGPIIGGVVQQFWKEVVWGDVDYMFIDMPPGTGDVPLTVFQSIPVDGIVIVTSPQELVSVIVEKAVKMAEMMNIPILGLVENMSYFECPSCGEKHRIYGESHLEDVAAKHGIKNIARLPIDPKLAAACDQGLIELFEGDWLSPMADAIEKA
ncbi:MAG: P-loop NTPase [Oscillospiraceae bacterium]